MCWQLFAASLDQDHTKTEDAIFSLCSDSLSQAAWTPQSPSTPPQTERKRYKQMTAFGLDSCRRNLLALCLFVVLFSRHFHLKTSHRWQMINVLHFCIVNLICCIVNDDINTTNSIWRWSRCCCNIRPFILRHVINFKMILYIRKTSLFSLVGY